jgi:hypothetical protein
MHRAIHAVTGPAVLAALALSTCVVVEPAAAAPSPPLHDLTALEELGASFDEGAGAPRLVLLLSPT